MAPDEAGGRIDEARFASEEELRRWCERLGAAGLRGTGSAAHEATIAWVEDELRRIPGVEVRSDPYEVLAWRPVPEGDLERAGALQVDGRAVRVAGAVPYSKPAQREGRLVHVPSSEAITEESAGGRVVLRDFPVLPIPYDLLLGLGSHVTPGADALRGRVYDRPGLADSLLHADLLAAGSAGAAAVVFAFDLPADQVAGYFEPHKGTHYAVPAVFVGADERALLLELTGSGASVSVAAEVTKATTRNLIATLPGQGPERIVLVTHTDGNTWVQENGAAALLALARHLAAIPIEHRHRTIELAFTSAHLHISREGSVRYAAQLDAEYDRGNVAFALAVEHLGARELVPVPREEGPGRRLVFSGEAEIVLWAVGPSDALQRAVLDAIEGRRLDRVLVAPGFGAAVEGRVPRITSFGGLGTSFHCELLPTTSLITGPWSLWAPSFGAEAIDVGLLRVQALAVGDVVRALDRVPRDVLAGDYLADRRARAAGSPTAKDDVPPEVAPA